MTVHLSSKSLACGLRGNMKTSFGIAWDASLLAAHTYKLFHILRGMFMNKYIFPGADASCSLGWVITQVRAFLSISLPDTQKLLAT